ncbi:hypothetical protein V3C99_015267 [Haemonchus contortus]
MCLIVRPYKFRLAWCSDRISSTACNALSLGTFVYNEVTSNDSITFPLLELGPSYAPSQSLGHGTLRKMVGSLQALHDRLRRKAKMDSLSENAQRVEHNTAIPPLPFPAMFLPPQEPNVVADTKFRLFATTLFSELRRNIGVRVPPNLSAAQRRGLKELRELSQSGAIKISVSDKGGEFVVLSQDLDRAMTRLHLQDQSTYSPSAPEEFTRQYRHLNKVWTETAKLANLPKTVISRLKCDLPICPVLYLLVKTHKLPQDGIQVEDPSRFNVRPIISCVGGPTDRIAWFLNLILIQLLRFVPAHLPNTNGFLRILREARLERGNVMESFDVTSLYTNVPRESALQAVLEILSEHHASLNLYGLTIRHIMLLLDESLKCNVFRWSGEYYKQVRGLAMGQRLAPALAIAFMSKVEKPVLERRPIIYCRYIDDCFVVCSTQTEMDTCFELLNRQSEHIKFTREKPAENWLAFLNVQIQFSHGIQKNKWYRKSSSKNILVHCSSAHPLKTKTAVVKNMFKTASAVSSEGDFRAESMEMARQIAQENGYGCNGQPAWRKRRARMEHAQEEERTKVPFCVPFVSDEMSAAIRACLRKADLQDSVRVVEIPPSNLKRQLVRNRLYDRRCQTPSCVICPSGKEGDCMISGVVYLITCQLCGEEYVGETGRPLCIRIKEHLDGLKKSRKSTPLGDHRIQHHENEGVTVSVMILSREDDISARKTLEALWIAAKNPTINRKDECVAITRELAPFADLCGFDLHSRYPRGGAGAGVTGENTQTR